MGRLHRPNAGTGQVIGVWTAMTALQARHQITEQFRLESLLLAHLDVSLRRN